MIAPALVPATLTQRSTAKDSFSSELEQRAADRQPLDAAALEDAVGLDAHHAAAPAVCHGANAFSTPPIAPASAG